MRRYSSLPWLLLCVFIATVGAVEVRAQDAGDGTVYSRFGLGELQTFGSPQIEAMGGRGTALHSPNYINFANPASWGDQRLTRVVAGGHYQSLNASVEGGATSTLNSGALNGVHFGVPLLSNRLGIAFGFAPFSRANYLAQRSNQVPTELGDTLNYTVNTEGRGGLQQIVGGGGYRINENIRVGGSVHFVFGILEDAVQTRFDDPAVFGTDLADATRLFGVTGTFGAIYSGTDMLRETDELSVGASFTLPTRLHGEQVRTLSGRTASTRDTLGTVLDGSVHVPLNLQVGASYRPDARWLVVLDGEFAPWTNFSADFARGDGRFASGTSDLSFIYADRSRISAGVEFLPAGNDITASFLSRVAYRLGAYAEQAYVMPSTDIDLSTMAVTGGLSLPTLVSGTRIDLNLEVGSRGTTDAGLVHDVYYRVSANVNIGERWFQERRFR